MSSSPKRPSETPRDRPRKPKTAGTGRISEPSPTRAASTGRTERFEFRLTPAQRALLSRAAMLDNESLTQFVVRSAVRAAKRKLLEEQPLLLTATDRAALVTALLEPPAPNAPLRAAYRRYRDEHA